jgi:nicotinamide mononucleotide transporter
MIKCQQSFLFQLKFWLNSYFWQNLYLSISDIYQQFITGMQHTSWYEYVAVFAGIASVWFSRAENILVYPVGLINTIIYIYISFEGHLLGEATVNLYYTIMSISGWYMWARKDRQQQPLLHITYSDKKDTYFKRAFFEGVIPWADAFASATAFTGMWLMTKKKVESWYWWIATNISSIPLYFVKQYVFTSVYYLILLVMAVFGLLEWKKKAKAKSL